LQRFHGILAVPLSRRRELDRRERDENGGLAGAAARRGLHGQRALADCRQRLHGGHEIIMSGDRRLEAAVLSRTEHELTTVCHFVSE
jgi:hypothetical protein